MKTNKIGVLLLALALVVSLGWVGSVAWDLSQIFRDRDADMDFINEPEGDVTPPPPEDLSDVEWEDEEGEEQVVEEDPYKGYIFDPDRVNVLLIGIDRGERRGPLSDTIMMLSFHKQKGDPVLMSIPRDTYVMIPGRYKDKINHSHAFGGAALLRRTVEGFTGIPIHHYLRVDFEGFATIVNMLGGVEVYVDRPMYDLQPGTQVLTGEQALKFVRFRNESRGDFARIDRQHLFLQAMARQVQNTALHKLPALIKEGVKHVDTDMPLMTLLDFASRFGSHNPNDLKRFVVPGRAFWYNGIYYLRPDENAMHEFVRTNMMLREKD